MNQINVLALAKINLSLNILGTNKDMHLIDSVMTSIDIGDEIIVKKRNDNKVFIQFCGDYDGFEQDNKQLQVDSTVKKTAMHLKTYKDFGAEITIKKNIPVGSGLGGSSADIAGTLFALNKLFCFKGINMISVGAKLGSDVPFMLSGGFARVTGIGEIVTPFKSELNLNAVVVFNKIGLSSKNVYGRYDQLNNNCIAGDFIKTQNSDNRLCCDNDLLVELLKKQDISAVDLFFNALYPAAYSLLPDINDTKQTLLRLGAKNAVMSGSGSSIVGFFDTKLNAKKAVNCLRAKGSNAMLCNLSKRGLASL